MNFGGSEGVYGYDDSEIIISPVPYDATSTWMKGADKGPDALLKASVNLEFYDIETDSEVHKHGIHTIGPILEKSSPEALVDAVYKQSLSLIKEGKFQVLVGGNHTVSIGSIKAFSESFENLTILQLDAHSDFRQEYEGSKYNHACVMARAAECSPVVQVGIRSMAAEELESIDLSRVFFSHKLHYDKTLYDKATDLLSDNVYITIDLDVLDPSIMSSTGTPEPGGLDYFELTRFLSQVACRKKIVGFDVVELCPSAVNKGPDFVAAKLVYQLLSYIYKGK